MVEIGSHPSHQEKFNISPLIAPRTDSRPAGPPAGHGHHGDGDDDAGAEGAGMILIKRSAGPERADPERLPAWKHKHDGAGDAIDTTGA